MKKINSLYSRKVLILKFMVLQKVVQNSSKETDHLLQEFENWLESCAGGDKKLEGAMQRFRQVLNIIQHVDPVKF